MARSSQGYHHLRALPPFPITHGLRTDESLHAQAHPVVVPVSPGCGLCRARAVVDERYGLRGAGWQDGKQIVVDPWHTSDYLLGFEFLGGGSGLVSTMQDYGRFAAMLCNWGSLEGRRILQKETLELMFTPQMGVGGERHFGLGFAIETVIVGGGKSAVTTKLYGWGGYANTEFDVFPELGLAMIFMRQTVPSTRRVSGKLFAMLRDGVVVTASVRSVD